MDGVAVLLQLLLVALAAGSGGVETVYGGAGVVRGEDIVCRVAVGATGVVPGALLFGVDRMGVLLRLDDDGQAVALQPGGALRCRAFALLDVAGDAVHLLEICPVRQLLDVGMAVEAAVVAVHALVQGIGVHVQVAPAAVHGGAGAKALLAVATQAVRVGDLLAGELHFTGQVTCRRGRLFRGTECGEGQGRQQQARDGAESKGLHSFCVNSG